MRTYLTIATAALVIAGVVASTAVAAPPDKVTFDSSFSFVDTTTCPGTTIVQSNEERDTIIEFSSMRVWIQRHGVATLSANGKTLTSNFSAMIFIDPTVERVKVAGTVYNIQVPGAGNVLLDAGYVVFDDATGSIVRVAGPHQQLLGDVAALCSYLGSP